MFIDKVREYAEKNKLLVKGDRIILGVSGGRDSVCLLDVLVKLKDEYELSLCVVHVNHGIRGEEADRDQRFVENMAKKYGIEYHCEVVDVTEMAKNLKMSEEEAGRHARYDAMRSICIEKGYRKIAVAHHMGDVAETVLFHLFRGSGPRGLSGIAPKREFLIRPILFASREEILDYIQENNLEYIDDSTNFEKKYSRNKLRLDVIPFIEENININAVEHIARAAEKIKRQNMYVEKQAKKRYMKIVRMDGGEYYFDCKDFLKCDEYICYEIIRLTLENMTDSLKDITEVHYKMIADLVEMDTGKMVCLPGGIFVEKRYDKVWFRDSNRLSRSVDIEVDVPFEKVIDIRGDRMRVVMDVIKREDLQQEIPEKDYTKWFDYDRIKNKMRFRNPNEGDYFIMDSEGNRKKLSRYFIDEKIPKSVREKEVVLADDNHVIWAIPGRISYDYKVTESTTNVLVVVITPG
ncbi:tRNA lysidine(34) synthetase TilS [Eubacterium xylanophilum]|uniref:tRNA lysidine(34) synthetase TilS n=1 Tax=Eubacterium xylanophilum TaxID=39497 RepID=UPI0004AF086D|nr:tRNA lysidine(34) synthetase TilS [Eubacterium xylanophilum]